MPSRAMHTVFAGPRPAEVEEQPEASGNNPISTDRSSAMGHEVVAVPPFRAVQIELPRQPAHSSMAALRHR